MEIRRGKIQRPERVVIYGPEGIGKTTFAASFPDPLFIDTEGSTSDLDVARLPDPNSWRDITEEIFYVRDHPDICKTLVIDTVDWAEKLCARYIYQKHQVDGLEGFGYGKGYVYLAEEFNRFLRALTAISDKGIHIVLTAHAAMRKFERPDESGAYDRWELKLEKKISPMVKEWSTMLLFANYDIIVVKDEKTKKSKAHGGSRVMYTTHHACWDAKNRKGLPDKLPFSFDAIRDYIPDILRAENSTTEQTAAKEPEPEPVREPEPPILDDLLEELKQLMDRDGYVDEDVRAAVASKGFYPEHIPVSQYDPKFIKEALINHWDGLKPVMDEIIGKKYPF